MNDESYRGLLILAGIICMIFGHPGLALVCFFLWLLSD